MRRDAARVGNTMAISIPRCISCLMSMVHSRFSPDSAEKDSAQ